MAGKTPPTDQEIRDELRKQGIDNFGQLVSEAARRLRERGGIEEERWYVFFGDSFVFVINEPF